MPDILIIEDDPAMRVLLSRSLQHLGTIHEAERLEEALTLVETRRFDLLLIDVHLRGRDGLEVLARVRNGKQNQATPAFVVTSDVSYRTRRMANEHASFFVQKPVRMPLLVTLVAGVLKVDPRVPHAVRSAPTPPPVVTTPTPKPSLVSTLSGLFRAGTASRG